MFDHEIARVAASDWFGTAVSSHEAYLVTSTPVTSYHTRPHGIAVSASHEHLAIGCRCGEVIQGKAEPEECPLFGEACTHENPVGPCMVSSEGACQAWFRYRGKERR